MSKHHRLSQAAWYLVRQYAGIYGVKMDYTAIKKCLKPVTVARAYFVVAKQPLIEKTVTYDIMGQVKSVRSYTPYEWTDVILKRAANGYKNRQFYDELARILAVWKTPFENTVTPAYHQWNAWTGHQFNTIAMANTAMANTHTPTMFNQFNHNITHYSRTLPAPAFGYW